MEVMRSSAVIECFHPFSHGQFPSNRGSLQGITVRFKLESLIDWVSR